MDNSVSWGGRREGLAWSTLIHIAALLALGALAAISDPASRLGSIRLVLPTALSPSVLLIPASTHLRGGGGGANSPLPPSRGRPPVFRPDYQLAPPSTRPPERAALEVEPALLGPAELNNTPLDSNLIGSPFAQLGPPSNGPGSHGGIGTGSEGGIGPSNGPGMGPGPGGGGVNGVYSIGGGVTAPRLIDRVEPEYSAEARKHKWQGTVVMLVEVWPDGLAHNIRVVGTLGLGLDEKAVEAVRAWRFAPGTKDGKPVRVRARIEVSFRLL